MTRFILIMCLCLGLMSNSISQVGINTDGSSPDPSAGLDIHFEDRGLLIPRLSIEQRDAIVNPADGLIIFNTTTFCLDLRKFGQWFELCGTAPVGIVTSLNCEGAIHAGSLTAGVAAAEVNSVISYAGGNGGTHAGQTINSTGVTGLTATLFSGAFNSGAGTLTYSISGTPSTDGTASFNIDVGGQECVLTRTVIAPPFTCGVSEVNFSYKGQQVNYGTVSGANNRCWLDRNLGALQVAMNSTDENAYGDLFQWGRGDDLHQNRISSTTPSLSSSDQPGHANFILSPNSPNDWRNPQNTNLWQGVSGINNPCPNGWRVPTQAEWITEYQSWSSNNAQGAMNSNLKLPLSGSKLRESGNLNNVGVYGFYWSATIDGTISVRLLFDNNSASMTTRSRADGHTVRCILN